MSTTILSITGLSGVGKSTAINIIKPLLTNCHFYTSEPRKEVNEKIMNLHKADKTNGIKQLQEAYFEENIFRVKDLGCQMLELDKSFVILNRGFEDTWVFTDFFAKRGLIDYNSFKQKYFEKLCPYFSDTFIYLYADREVLTNRLIKRNFDKGKQLDKVIDYKEPFLKEMFSFYENWYLRQDNCHVIDTTQLTSNQVAEKLLQLILHIQINQQ